MRRIATLCAIILIGAFGPALAQSLPPPPSGTVIERQTVETSAFTHPACRGRPNGYYCGTGTNRQLLYECMDGQIASQTPCPGDCNPATLSCPQKFGVKGIDPPKK